MKTLQRLTLRGSSTGPLTDDRLFESGTDHFPPNRHDCRPDGKRAAVIRQGKVTIWPVGAGESRDLTTPSEAVDMLAWDGSTHVVYAARDGGLYRQRADGTAAATLVTKMPCTGGPVTSSDGRLACSDGSGRITVIGVDGSGKRTVQPSENPARLVGWTADNRHVYSSLEGSIPTWVARTAREWHRDPVREDSASRRHGRVAHPPRSRDARRTCHRVQRRAGNLTPVSV
jgi:hypothetical protein